MNFSKNDINIDANSRGGANAGTLIALMCAAMATAGASLTALGHVKDAAISAVLRGQPIGPSLLFAALGPVDLAFVAVSILAVSVLLWMEWRRRALTTLLRTAGAGEAFVLATLFLLWTGHGYLFPGLLLGGDTASHVVRFHKVARGLEAGVMPGWTNYSYTGEPLLWFTGPLTYIIGGTLTFLIRDANLSLKLMLFVTHVLAGWAFWALLRRWKVRPIAACVGAACFGGAFANLHLFFYRGESPQALTIVLLVVLFHAADGLLRGVGRKWLNFSVFALTTAALIVNHQPHAIFAAMYLAVFGAVAAALGFWRWRLLPALIVAGMLGVVASVAAVMPLLLEADWVMMEPAGAAINARWPTAARLARLVVWHNTLGGRGTEYWTYLGLGLIVLAIGGAIALIRGRLRPPAAQVALPAAICLVPCFFLHNPVVRDVMFILFFGGILAAVGLDWLLDNPILAGRRLTALIAIIAVDLLSTAIQPIARTDKDYQIEAGRYLEREAPDQRIAQIDVDAQGGLRADMGPGGVIMNYRATVQRVAGAHNMAATRVHNFVSVAIKQAEEELQANCRLSSDTRTILGLFNVSRVVCVTALGMGCPASFMDTAETPILGRYVPIAATPVLFSPNLATVASPAGLEKPMFWDIEFDVRPHSTRITGIGALMRSFLETELANLETRTAGAIPVREVGYAAPTGARAPIEPLVLRAYAVDVTSVVLRIEAPARGYVQIAHPWVSSRTVTVNGVAARPLRGTMEFMVLPVDAGESVIAIRETLTTVRRMSLFASAMGLLAILAATAGVAFGERRRLPA